LSIWTEIDLTSISTEPVILPENTEFIFELLPGARYGKFDSNRIEASAKVVSGEFAGQIKYFSYPDPEKQPWSTGVFVRMTHALGEEVEAGEDPVEYLNRNAGKQFISKVKHRRFSSDGVDGVKDEVAIGNVKPVR
jgi:hypothetical protein